MRLEYCRDLVLVLLAKELKVRYKRTFMGYAWSLLHPLAFAMVFFVLFQVVMGIRVEGYALFLITGLFPWHWFSNSVAAANSQFLGNAPLIRKVRFPWSFLVLSGVLNDLVHFLVSIPVIVAFMLYYGKWPTLHWFWILPALIAIQLLLTYGIGVALATANLFFRDLERIVNILTLMLFYLSPVLYPVEKIPAEYRWTVFVNPVGALMASWHSAFLEGAVPPAYLLAAAGHAVLAAVLGHGLYRALEWRLAEIV